MYDHELMKQALVKKKAHGIDLTAVMGHHKDGEEANGEDGSHSPEFMAGEAEGTKEAAKGIHPSEKHEAAESPEFEAGEEKAKEDNGELAPDGGMDNPDHGMEAVTAHLNAGPFKPTALRQHAAIMAHEKAKKKYA